MITADTQSRTSFIGASEVGACLGISHWRTPVDLWLEKTGRTKPFEGNELTKAGHKLEHAVSLYFEEESGHRVIKKTTEEYSVIHPIHDFIRCHPDREYFRTDGGGRGALELKTKYFNTPEKGDLPLDWYCQNQYQMGLLKLEHGSIAWLAFHFGPTFDYEEFGFDPQLFEWIVNKVGEFWHDYVIKDTPPPMQNTSDVLSLFPSHVKGKSIEATDETLKQIHGLKEIKVKLSSLQADFDHLSEPIKMLMEDAERLTYAGKDVLTWRKAKDSVRVDAQKLKTEYPEVYADVLQERQGSRRFLIKI